MKRELVMCMVVGCLLVGCGSEDDGVPNSGVDAPTGGGNAISYEPMTVRTRSLGDGNSDRFVLSLTDASGQIACGLSNDFHASLGSAGNQIFADLGHIAGYPCPTGSHTITNANCPSDLKNEFSLREGCAYYRRFNSTGAVVGILPATAGNITVTGNESTCSFSVSLSFSGQMFSTSFQLTNGLTAQPWWQLSPPREALIEPDKRGIFVTDQLDTHRAATLVELVARRCGIEDKRYSTAYAARTRTVSCAQHASPSYVTSMQPATKHALHDYNWSNSSYDFAVIEFSDSQARTCDLYPGHTVGWYGWWTASDEQISGRNSRINGYPAIPPAYTHSAAR